MIFEDRFSVTGHVERKGRLAMTSPRERQNATKRGKLLREEMYRKITCNQTIPVHVAFSFSSDKQKECDVGILLANSSPLPIAENLS